jgi:hypothetical protein
MCSIVFRQIKLRSCPKISWYVLVLLIHKVNVSMPLELYVDISPTLVLKNCCFSTSRTTSAYFSTSRTTTEYFSTYRATSGCFNTSSIKTDVLVPRELQVDVSVPLEQQMDVSSHNATYH